VIWANAVSLVNARVAAGDRIAQSIRFSSRVLSIDERPKHGDTVLDLQGGIVLPGLVNAHDHLELNHYGRIKARDRYENASGWIADMAPRLSSDPVIRDGRAHPLIERLFIGGLKNLLSGVTTVAHHNPFYAELRRTMPIRVVRRYGWAHSFLLETQPAGARGEPGGDVATRWRKTPADAPFLVHLAEGVDEEARSELPRLESLGCLTPNTVMVHGVAVDEHGGRRVARAGGGFVWCPASNAFLFGHPGRRRRRPRRSAVTVAIDGFAVTGSSIARRAARRAQALPLPPDADAMHRDCCAAAPGAGQRPSARRRLVLPPPRRGRRGALQATARRGWCG
jgi:cytosine/adenosine deaminase-related metal-dependent hydrolase